MKIAFTSDTDDDGNATCLLQLKSFDVGFPAPNFASRYWYDGKALDTWSDNILSKDETGIAKLQVLAGTAGKTVGWLNWWPFRLVGADYAAKPLELLLGLTLKRKVDGLKRGLCTWGSNSSIPFLGAGSHDTYKLFAGKGGATIKVIPPKKNGTKQPECYDTSITTYKHSPRASPFSAEHIVGTKKAGSFRSPSTMPVKSPLTVKWLSSPREQRGAVKVTYKPKKDYVGEDSFNFRVDDGERKRRLVQRRSS